MSVHPDQDGGRAVIACGSMRPEIDALLGAGRGVDVRYLPQALHRTPERLTEVLQEAIDGIDGGVSQVVLAYGLCSNGVVGVRAPSQGLAIPRVHDCIALLLGSRRAYRDAFSRRPGTYYLTPGWVAERKDPLGVMEHDYVPRVGREDAEWSVREELKHYTHITLIRTAATNGGALRERAMENATFLGKQYDEIDGSPQYLEAVLFGQLEEPDFVLVAGGQRVSQEPFLD